MMSCIISFLHINKTNLFNRFRSAQVIKWWWSLLLQTRVGQQVKISWGHSVTVYIRQYLHTICFCLSSVYPLSICLCLSIYGLSIYLSVYVCVYVCVCLSSIAVFHLSVYASVFFKKNPKTKQKRLEPAWESNDVNHKDGS